LSRRVYVTGITANPVREWVTARNLSFILAERIHPAKLIIPLRAAEAF
jgi:hypothetical protein